MSPSLRSGKKTSDEDSTPGTDDSTATGVAAPAPPGPPPPPGPSVDLQASPCELTPFGGPAGFGQTLAASQTVGQTSSTQMPSALADASSRSETSEETLRREFLDLQRQYQNLLATKQGPPQSTSPAAWQPGGNHPGTLTHQSFGYAPEALSIPRVEYSQTATLPGGFNQSLSNTARAQTTVPMFAHTAALNTNGATQRQGDPTFQRASSGEQYIYPGETPGPAQFSAFPPGGNSPSQPPANGYGAFNIQPTTNESARQSSNWMNHESNPLAQMTAVIVDAIRQSQTGGTPRSHPEDLVSLIARQSSAKDLPPYAGDPIEWQAWKAQFHQSTATCGMTAAENLIRLQRALKGKAREAVSPLLMDPAQVPEIMDVLEHRFGSAHSIATVMFERIKRLTRLVEDASTEALVEFSGAVQNVVASLGNLRSDYLSNPALLSEIASKMPLALRISWLEKVADQTEAATVRQLAAFLKRLTNAVPRSGLTDNSRAPRPYVSEHRATRPRRESVFLANERSEAREVKCLMCEDVGHKLYKCPRFAEETISARWELVKNARVCVKCLDGVHQMRLCKYKINCGVGACRVPHHRLLHDSGYTRDPDVQTVTNTWDNKFGKVLLKIVPVTLCGPEGQVTVHALLDEGSTVTLVDAEIADIIGATGPVRGLRIHGANGMCSSDDTSRRVSVTIQGDGEAFTVKANTVRDLNLPRQATSGSHTVIPRLLLGQDNAHLIVSREVREEADRRLISRTALGWITHGGATPSSHTTLSLISEVDGEAERRLTALVKQNFAIDSLGVSASCRTNAATTRAEMMMRDTTRPCGPQRWETGLLWREDDTQLPNNRQCAVNRQSSLERKLARDTTLAAAYREKMALLVSRGYAEQLTAAEAARPSDRKWYLPHFAVRNPNKPGKIRVVFDAASSCRGVSLNDKLLKGPDLLTSLLGNLLRFREGKTAIAADIAEMFLQIKIIQKDRDSQLFLWRDSAQEELRTYRLTSMMFGATCSPSSAQFVRNKVAEEHEAEFPAAAAAVKSKFYMDDYLDAVDTAAEAAILTNDVTTLLRRGGFTLTNWASNDPAAIARVPPDQKAKSLVPITNGAEASERILGLVWEPTSDKFIYTFTATIEEISTHPTKRQLLSYAMKIFDPVGFLACVTIRAKILLQDVWRSSIKWDEKIREEHAVKWGEWLQLLRQSSVTIPRRCLLSKGNSFTLHLFCDTSEAACCAVAYLVETTGEGSSTATFLSSKCKVAPLKPLSIPRLELQGALMAARLANTIKKECQAPIGTTTYWTDSTTVLCWLRTDPRNYSTFVANRLGEIDELSDIASWRWVPTKLNPADIGTRDLETLDLTQSGRWFSGPSFLTAPKLQWPQERQTKMQPDDQKLEVRPKFVGLTHAVEEALPSVARFSSWNRLIRTTAWMLRFIRRCRQGPNKPTEGPLILQELRAAEWRWIRHSQEAAFGTELHQLKLAQTISTGSRLISLAPHLHNGVLRMGSRLKGVKGVPESPIILDGGNSYTRLLVNHHHIRADHPSVETTMAEIRTSFYILKLRSALRHIKHMCPTCKMRRGKPSPPMMAPLPMSRLAH